MFNDGWAIVEFDGFNEHGELLIREVLYHSLSIKEIDDFVPNNEFKSGPLTTLFFGRPPNDLCLAI